jgi:hypothetical protein
MAPTHCVPSIPAWAIVRRGPTGPVTYLDLPPGVLRAAAAASAASAASSPAPDDAGAGAEPSAATTKAAVAAAGAAAVPFLLSQRFPPWAIVAAAGPLPPRARLPGRLGYADWCALYARDLDRMLRYLRARVGGGDGLWSHWDWAGVRRSLAAYAYATSANRSRAFRRLK